MAVPTSRLIEEAYNRYSATYDDLDGGDAANLLGFPELRKTLLSEAAGRVLEVGAGTGLNMGYYDWDQVASLTMLDISAGMLGQAKERAAQLLPGRGITFLQGDVCHLPFEPGSFDMVVDTFSMCVFPQPQQAIQEMHRVLAPGGKLLLLEHSRSPNPLLGLYQDLTSQPVAALGGKGCVWNQDLPKMLRQAGLPSFQATSHLGGLITMLQVPA